MPRARAGKRGGVLWLGTEDSRGPGGNFDSGCSALAGIPQAPGGKPLQLLPSRDAPTPAILRGARSPLATGPRVPGYEKFARAASGPGHPALSQASQARGASSFPHVLSEVLHPDLGSATDLLSKLEQGSLLSGSGFSFQPWAVRFKSFSWTPGDKGRYVNPPS